MPIIVLRTIEKLILQINRGTTMKKLYSGIFIFFFLTIGQVQAQQVDAEKSGYKLYRNDIVKILDLTSALALAGGNLPVSDQWDIYYYCIAYFELDPERALRNFKVMHEFLDRINKSESNFEYRLAIQSVYHKAHYEWTFQDIGKHKDIDSVFKKHNPIFEMNKELKFFVKYNDGYETDKDGYYLTTFMLDSMVEIAEFLAKSRLSDSDKSKIKTWARKDFEADPAQRTRDYAYFINKLLPQIYNTALPKNTSAQSSSDLEQQRERLYRWYYFEGVKRNSLNLGYDLMDIVTKYNPVLIEDTENEDLMPESALYTSLSTYKFVEDVIGIPVQLTAENYLVEKNSLIKQFLNRKKKEPSSAYVAIQYKERWTTFDNQTKANIAAKMKKLYVDTGSIGSAIKPMFDVLLNDLTFNYILASQALFLANSNQYILQIFNDMNSRHAQIIDDIASSNNKFNTRLNLQIGGATILQDRGDYFVVEYHPNGIRYNVHI